MGSHAIIVRVTATDTRRILDSIRLLVRFLRVTDRAAQSDLGLSAAQIFVLHELGKTAALSLNELAETTRTDQSSVSAVVTKLVDAGLVVRERSATDARRLELTLTAAGRRAMKKAPPIAQETLIDAIERLPARERKAFAATFDALIASAGIGGDRAVPMLFEEESGPKRGRKRAAK